MTRRSGENRKINQSIVNNKNKKTITTERSYRQLDEEIPPPSPPLEVDPERGTICQNTFYPDQTMIIPPSAPELRRTQRSLSLEDILKFATAIKTWNQPLRCVWLHREDGEHRKKRTNRWTKRNWRWRSFWPRRHHRRPPDVKSRRALPRVLILNKDEEDEDEGVANKHKVQHKAQ